MEPRFLHQEMYLDLQAWVSSTGRFSAAGSSFTGVPGELAKVLGPWPSLHQFSGRQLQLS